MLNFMRCLQPYAQHEGLNVDPGLGPKAARGCFDHQRISSAYPVMLPGPLGRTLIGLTGGQGCSSSATRLHGGDLLCQQVWSPALRWRVHSRS